ncbi:MAG: midcut-by-XrtH protein, partial [Pseudomonadota bacterium]
CSFAFASPAMAGQDGATIFFSPLPVGVPMLGGAALMALAALLALVALRLLKTPNSRGSSAMIAATTCAALAAGTGGIVLVEEAQAGGQTLTLLEEDNGVLGVPNETDVFMVINGTDEALQIERIEFASECFDRTAVEEPLPCEQGAVLEPNGNCNIDLICI